MLAEKQVEAVANKLRELNPDFDGKVHPKIDNGVVTEFSFSTDDVTDISPVRALTGLRALTCFSSATGKGKLSDLSPLTGMPLTKLALVGINVSDLSPLKGIPLTNLGLSWSMKVADISPLQGMPLESLICPGTAISDLSPLKGMPLTVFSGDFTKVADLSPLEGMKLKSMCCQGTLVSDLSPLRGMPLSLLRCNGSKVSDLSPLQGMNLNEVGFTPKNITVGLNVIRQMKSVKFIATDEHGRLPSAEFWKKYDAGELGKPQSTRAAKKPLAFETPGFEKWVKAVAAQSAERQVEAVAKKLQELNPGFDGGLTHKIDGGVVTELGFAGESVSDISPVRTLAALKRLSCFSRNWDKEAKLSDLSPLRSMKITELFCYHTMVSDLSPLKGMPLVTLNCGSTPVADLSPLRGAPLKILICDATNVSDLAPLHGMPLTSLAFTPAKITHGIEVVRNMKSVTILRISGHSDQLAPAEFWQKYDAGEFNK
jgi:Leucine-rich repeat (LRR) protein